MAIYTISNGTKRLTYGIELECIFAFHESELDRHRDEDASNFGPVKNLPYGIRGTRPFTTTPSETKRAYNSWGVIANDPVFNDNNGDHPWPFVQIVPYDKQPMIMASRLVSKETGLDIKVPGHREIRDSQYGHWHITSDPTVVGVGSKHLPKYLPDRINENNKFSWDSFGIGIVSRVLSVGNSADTKEIENVVRAILGTEQSRHGAFITNQAGLHVHVLAPHFKALQELAYILLAYEEKIHSIHAPCRHEKHPMNSAESSDTNAKHFWNVPTLQERRTKILECPDVDALALLVGLDKSQYVRFERAASKSINTHTIKFLQHRGTLDVNSIRWWVEFCVSLIRLSVHYADTDTHCPITDYDQERSVFDLLDEMGFSEPGKQYYREIFFRYQDYPSEGPLNANDFELEPARDNSAKYQPSEPRSGTWFKNKNEEYYLKTLVSKRTRRPFEDDESGDGEDVKIRYDVAFDGDGNVIMDSDGTDAEYSKSEDEKTGPDDSDTDMQSVDPDSDGINDGNDGGGSNRPSSYVRSDFVSSSQPGVVAENTSGSHIFTMEAISQSHQGFGPETSAPNTQKPTHLVDNSLTENDNQGVTKVKDWIKRAVPLNWGLNRSVSGVTTVIDSLRYQYPKVRDGTRRDDLVSEMVRAIERSAGNIVTGRPVEPWKTESPYPPERLAAGLESLCQKYKFGELFKLVYCQDHTEPTLWSCTVYESTQSALPVYIYYGPSMAGKMRYFSLEKSQSQS